LSLNKITELAPAVSKFLTIFDYKQLLLFLSILTITNKFLVFLYSNTGLHALSLYYDKIPLTSFPYGIFPKFDNFISYISGLFFLSLNSIWIPDTYD